MDGRQSDKLEDIHQRFHTSTASNYVCTCSLDTPTPAHLDAFMYAFAGMAMGLYSKAVNMARPWMHREALMLNYRQICKKYIIVKNI